MTVTSPLWFCDVGLRYFGKDFSYRRIESCLPADCTERHKINLLTAYFLVYFLTSAYPDEIWGNAVYESDVLRYKDIHRSYLSECNSVGIAKDLMAKADMSLRFVEYGVRGLHAETLLRRSFLNDVEIAELLTDAVFLKNKNTVTNYTPEKWLKLFTKKREHHHDCLVKGYMSSKKWSGFWATRQGESHARCDDMSGICKIDKDAWFAYVADGVGSCGASHIGAKLAGEAFFDIIRRAYARYKNAPGNFMYYLQNSFARDSCKLWQKRIKKQGKEDILQYSTTFLFTFHCRAFIVCGMIGDGVFVIEKNGATAEKKGYQVITDGFSDVVQHNVLNVNTLRLEPYKMQLVFYKPSEISGIWMSSDGALGVTFEALDSVLLADRTSYIHTASVFDKMRALSNEMIYNQILDFTYKFSRSNMSQGGRGDDCSIVFIKAD
jgi:hypothetical protein